MPTDGMCGCCLRQELNLKDAQGRKQLNAVSLSGFQVLLTDCVLVQAAHSHEKPSDYHIWAARPPVKATRA